VSDEHQHGAGWQVLDIAVICSCLVLAAFLVAGYVATIRAHKASTEELTPTDAPDVAQGVAPVPAAPRRARRKNTAEVD
jgi:hypothetical protein